MYDPSFEYTNITINYNLKCKRHRDSGNSGRDSLIIGFGDYSGGALCVERDGNVERHDIFRRFLRFDGAAQYHWVMPFVGERYTAVFYAHSGISSQKTK
jgi:hypothetical protein